MDATDCKVEIFLVLSVVLTATEMDVYIVSSKNSEIEDYEKGISKW